MPLSLSTVVTEDKNKIASDSVTFAALSISIPGLSEVIRVCEADQDVVWNGYTWQSFPMRIGDISESTTELPKLTLDVANVSSVLSNYIQTYDTYCKNNGFQPIQATLYLLNSLDLANTSPIVQYDYLLNKSTVTSQWVTFELGSDYVMNRRFPSLRILKDHCSFVFKSNLCGYAGTAAKCDKSLSNCRSLNNQSRFGGFPGCGAGGLRIAT